MNKQRLILILFIISLTGCTTHPHVPTDSWQRYANPIHAGWNPAQFEKAHQHAQSIGSAAYMLVHDGTIVDTYGDITRRYMCHSVRKSFLSALYGIHVDRNQLNIDHTLEQLGIDDKQKLTPIEKSATLRHLLKARSGVYHPAAYETKAMAAKRPKRGAHPPDTFYYYNNWDFNTLMTVLEQQTNTRIFEDFYRHFAQPLGMEDFRISDGYYHLEHHSNFPAYPFRMSARDMARFGLLYLRNGNWNGKQILSEQWINESTASYSKLNRTNQSGYGYMWWILNDKLNAKFAYAALGVGNQTIIVMPHENIVFVHRTDTWQGDRVSLSKIYKLTNLLLEAKTNPTTNNPKRIDFNIPDKPTQPTTNLNLAQYVGDYQYGLNRTVKITLNNNQLSANIPNSGTFTLIPQPDNTFLIEDSHYTANLTILNNKQRLITITR